MRRTHVNHSLVELVETSADTNHPLVELVETTGKM